MSSEERMQPPALGTPLDRPDLGSVYGAYTYLALPRARSIAMRDLLHVFSRCAPPLRAMPCRYTAGE